MNDQNGSNGAKIIQFPERGKGPLEDSPSLNMPREANFALFAMAIQSHQVPIASKILSEILGIDDGDAALAASHFYQAYMKDENVQSKAITIRQHLEAGDYNKALVLLHQCFNLQGPPAIQAVTALKERLTAKPALEPIKQNP